MNYSDFFWKHIDTLSSDTSLAHSFGEKVWNHQQEKIDKLTRELNLMKGWENIANVNDGEKRKYIKRISDAIKYIEEHYGCVELSNITDILTGFSET